MKRLFVTLVAVVVAAAAFLPVGAASAAPAATANSCDIEFSDVQLDSPFYPYIHGLACLGIVSGYSDGTFRPGNEVSRGQLSKIVANAAGFSEDPGSPVFQDIPADSPFFVYVQRLANKGYISGYACGGAEEPCVPPENKPYFRPNGNASRGQISKIVSNAAGFKENHTEWQYQDVPTSQPFYQYIQRLSSRNVMSGYACGGVIEEPCLDPENRPYLRPGNNASRGQTAKIVANAFFPSGQMP